MKILSLHCDYITFKPLKKALKEPEILSEERKKEITVDEPLVVMISVEKHDEKNSKIVSQLSEEIIAIAHQLKVKNIVLYPYAHLSPSLSKPDFALQTLEQTEKMLHKHFHVVRAPFGYYKEFECKVKGHPLSELSRDLHFEGEIDAHESETYNEKQLLREISKSKLDTSKLKENDHRILGQKMNLFSFSEVAPGMVFWHNNGLLIRNELISYWRDVHRKTGYQEILTPQIMDKRLWQISGHWEKYRDHIFLTHYEKRDFAVKPMNCPGGMLVYRHSPKSYKDLPLRVAELGNVHRQELSGVLAGLFRVVQFTQDDAHIFCTEDQIVDEILSVISLIDELYKKFNFSYTVELSTRPEKRIGSDKIWDTVEKTLEKALKKQKIKFSVKKGEGSFYGPKIDFHIKDSLERTWQCGTIQLDFSMPERFELQYIDKDNTIKQPIMIHRTIFGSLERFIGILIEHYHGHLPVWLSPVHVLIINFTDRNNNACEKLVAELHEKGIRVESDLDSEPLNGKIKSGELKKIPYIVVIGDKEEKNKTVAVRHSGKIQSYKKDEFIQQLLKEIKEKR